MHVVLQNSVGTENRIFSLANNNRRLQVMEVARIEIRCKSRQTIIMDELSYQSFR